MANKPRTRIGRATAILMIVGFKKCVEILKSLKLQCRVRSWKINRLITKDPKKGDGICLVTPAG